MLKPTLIGGAVFGFLGAVPLVSAINCACCALVMGAGFLAAYIYSTDCKKFGLEFGAAAGAKIGVLAGLIYAIVNAIFNGLLSIVMRAFTGGQDWEQVLDQLEAADAPPEMIDMAEQGIEIMTGPMGPVIGFFVVLVLALIFSTIGGLIGGAVFKVQAVPPAPPTSSAPPSYTEPGDPPPGP
jgi:hypothetical protein